MSRKEANFGELLPGTLEMLILTTLRRGALHGYGIAQRIGEVSGEVLRVGEGSLYPALQRLLKKGWVEAEWGETETGRKARIYRLTRAGAKQVAVERAQFRRMVGAIAAVMGEA